MLFSNQIISGFSFPFGFSVFSSVLTIIFVAVLFKTVPRIHKVIVSLKQEWKFGRTRKAAWLSRPTARQFPQHFRVLPNFYECYHNFMETGKESF